MMRPPGRSGDSPRMIRTFRVPAAAAGSAVSPNSTSRATPTRERAAARRSVFGIGEAVVYASTGRETTGKCASRAWATSSHPTTYKLECQDPDVPRGQAGGRDLYIRWWRMAYWMSSALVLMFNCSIIRYLWKAILRAVTFRTLAP